MGSTNPREHKAVLAATGLVLLVLLATALPAYAQEPGKQGTEQNSSAPAFLSVLRVIREVLAFFKNPFAAVAEPPPTPQQGPPQNSNPPQPAPLPAIEGKPLPPEVILGVTPRNREISYPFEFTNPPEKDQALSFRAEEIKRVTSREQNADHIQLTERDSAYVTQVEGTNRGQKISVDAQIAGDQKDGQVKVTVTVAYPDFSDELRVSDTLPEDRFTVKIPFYLGANQPLPSFDVRVIKNAPGVVVYSSALPEDSKKPAKEIARREGWNVIEAEPEADALAQVTKIRNKIREANDAAKSHPLEYLFIIGSDKTIPMINKMEALKFSPLTSEHLLDETAYARSVKSLVLDAAFYGNIDADKTKGDYQIDVAVGRLPFESPESLEQYLQVYYAPAKHPVRPYEMAIWQDLTPQKYAISSVDLLKTGFLMTKVEYRQIDRTPTPAEWPANVLPFHVHLDKQYLPELLKGTAFAILNTHGNATCIVTPPPLKPGDTPPATCVPLPPELKTFSKDLPEFTAHNILYCAACLTAQAFGVEALSKGLANFLGFRDESIVNMTDALSIGFLLGKPAASVGGLVRDQLNALDPVDVSKITRNDYRLLYWDFDPATNSIKFNKEKYGERQKNGVVTLFVLYGNPRTTIPEPLKRTGKPTYELKYPVLRVTLPPLSPNEMTFGGMALEKEDFDQIVLGNFSLGALKAGENEQENAWMRSTVCHAYPLSTMSIFLKASPERFDRQLKKIEARDPTTFIAKLWKSKPTRIQELIDENLKEAPWHQKGGKALPLAKYCGANFELTLVASEGKLFWYTGQTAIPVEGLQAIDLAGFTRIKKATAYDADGNPMDFFDLMGKHFQVFLPLEGDTLKYGFSYRISRKSPDLLGSETIKEDHLLTPEETFSLIRKTRWDLKPLTLEFELE